MSVGITRVASILFGLVIMGRGALVAAQDAEQETNAPEPPPDLTTPVESENEGENAEPTPESPDSGVSPSQASPEEGNSEHAEGPPETVTPPSRPAAVVGSPAPPNEAPTTADGPDPGGTQPKDHVYAGLDHTGTPPTPPLDNRPTPAGTPWTPQYDGRDPGRLRAEEALIWIPRGVLFPLHLALEYVVRKPLVWLITRAEEGHVPERVGDFFTFADGRGTAYPSVFYDAGRGVWFAGNVGLRDIGTEGHSLRAFGGYGTGGWYQASLTEEWKVFDNNAGTLVLNGSFGLDPNQIFTGIGPETSLDDRVFLGERRGEASADLRIALHDLNRFSLRLAYRNVKLEGGRSPSIDDSESPFDPQTLVGFDDPYNLITIGVGLELDSRSPVREFTPGSGLRLEAQGSFSSSLGALSLRYFRYGLHPMAFWDISGVNHVLSAGIYAEAISQTSGDELPVLELVTLGGNEQLLGFLLGRSRGESALVMHAAYSWPVLFFADAVLFWELGNAFNGFFDDLAFENMLMDWGVALRSSFSREFAVVIGVGFGTNQIDAWSDDFNVDNVRFVLGASRAF